MVYEAFSVVMCIVKKSPESSSTHWTNMTTKGCERAVYIINKMSISCFQSTYRPLSFIYMHIRHICFPLRAQNMILECLVLGVPLLSPPLHCPLELQQFSAGWSWGGVSWRRAQCSSSGTDTHKHWALGSCVSCLCPVLTRSGRLHVSYCWGWESTACVCCHKTEFYLVMLKSFTWILQLCRDGAETLPRN